MSDFEMPQLVVGLLFVVAHLTSWKVLDGQRTRGVAWWCAGGIMMGCGWTLAGMARAVPPGVVFPVSQCLVFSGGLLCLHSLYYELGVGQRLPGARIAQAAAVYLLLAGAGWGLAGAALSHRVATLVQAGVFGYLAFLARRWGREQTSRNARWIAGTFACLSAALLVRFGVLGAGGADFDASAIGWDLTLFGLAGVLAGTASAVGAVGIQLERLQHEQLSLVLDSLARTMAQKTLKEERVRLAGILEATRAGTWEWNVQTGETHPNERWAEILGYRREEIAPLSYENWKRMVHPEDLDAVLTKFDQHFRGEVAHYRCEMRLQHRDGRWVWVEDCGKVTAWTEDGQPLVMLGCHQDITARRAMEEEIRQLNVGLEHKVRERTAELAVAKGQTEAALEEIARSETRLRSITEAARDAIVMMDPRGVVSFWNPAAEQVFGYRREEAIGKDLHRLLVPPGYRASFEAVFPEFVRTGDGRAVGTTMELVARRRDGREIPVALSLSAVFLRGGWHAVGIVRDITSQRQLQEKLDAARQAAEDASRTKSQFLANMSHEIRTPLNGVIGMTGLLLDSELNAEQQRYAEMLQSSGENLLALIDDILDISKIEAGGLDPEWLDCDLRQILDDVAGPLGLRAQKKGIQFICAVAPDVPDRIRSVPNRLRQVLTNLAGNAIKFTEQGEVVVRACLVREPEQEPRIRFTVRDTGIGIALDQQHRLFRNFAQADVSITRRYGGFGLGLAISKQLVELMGGHIGLTSELGQGTEFWFTVPLIRAASPGEPARKANQRNGQRVLVVEGNATQRDVLVEQMAALGLDAVACGDGPAGLEVLARAQHEGQPFHAALLDAPRPDNDGVAVARAIRADIRFHPLRLVLMTPIDFRCDPEELGSLALDDRLTKPIRHAELVACLGSVLSDRTDAGRSNKSSAAAKPPTPRVQGARILVVEDNVVNQQVALAILRRLGMHADATGDGRAAVERLTRESYDLVLMDVQMPQMDGLEATRIIRTPDSGVRNRQIPIIAMTAAAMRGNRERCLEAGMNDYVTKPISPRTLLETLERWLDGNLARVPGVPLGSIAEGTPEQVG